MKSHSLSLIRTAALAIIPLTAIAPTRAQTVPVVLLDEMVVSAQRASHRIVQTPSAISLVPLEETRTAGEYALEKVLSKQPGTIVVNSGAVGSQTSVYMRGANSHQTLFFVDGVRMNDTGTPYLNFLGGANTAGIDRLEVLRGPQSTLYGSSAMGGVIAIDTARGIDGTTGRLEAEYGSFNTFAASAEITGGVQGLGYSLSVARDQTDNDRENNAFESWTYNGRFEGQITETVTIGATLRGLTSTYEEPGSTLATFPSEGTAETEDHLLTAYGEWRASDGFKSRLTGGLHRRDYVWISTWDDSPSQNDRRILDWLNTWSVNSDLEMVGGVNYEKSDAEIPGYSTDDSILAAYASGVYRPVESVTLTAGLRYDDYDSVGGATTWRLGGSWQATPTTHLRSTIGTGFSAPSSGDRFGVPSWGQLPNPNLEAETSTGFDLGIDQQFAAADTVASATVFYNDFRNLFEYEIQDWTTYEGMVVNRAEASTSGVELAVATRPGEVIFTRLAYTYLTADNETDGTRLIRRPRHTLDADIRYEPSEQWSIGLGLRGVADQATEGAVEPDDYFIFRAYGRVRVWEEVVAKIRVENLFDTTYEEVPGYPALPFGVYGGIEWTF